MNILQIPEEDESIALQRFLNLFAYVARNSIIYNQLITIDGKEYGTYTNNGAVYFIHCDESSGINMEWELVVPRSWHDNPEYDAYRSIEIDEHQFVSDFHEFIDDYVERAESIDTQNDIL